MRTARLLTAPVWNQTDEAWEERPRTTEEQVDMRRARKRLADCVLPEGFRLVTPQPKQFWMDTQFLWGFKLAWGRVDRQGRRERDEFEYVARYESRISDEVQMRWAVDDFTRELEQARPKKEPRFEMIFSMRLA